MDIQQNGLAGPGFHPAGAPGDLTLSRISRPLLELSRRPTSSGAKVGTLLAELPYAKERRLSRGSKRSSAGGRAAPRATELIFNGLHHRRRQTVIVASAILLAVLAYLAITGTTILQSADPVAGTPAPTTTNTTP